MKLSAGDFKYYYYDEVDSTSLLSNRMLNNEKDPFVVIANKQTNGKGRKGNSFLSLQGGIYFTITIPTEYINNEDLITFNACLSVVNALEKITGEKLFIKWVNDIFYNQKKVCGILCEKKCRLEKSYLLIGIGINNNVSFKDTEIENIASSLHAKIDKDKLVEDIIDKILYFDSLDRNIIIKEYKNKMFLINKKINFEYKNSLKSGKILDIGINGELIVETDEGVLKIISGEISLKSSTFTK